jgi:hypothetical protein
MLLSGGAFKVGAGQVQRASDAQALEAWRALRNDDAIQFDLTPAPPEPKAPDWLRTLGEWIADFFRPVGRALEWINSLMPDAPYARILLWIVLVLAAGALLWMLLQRWRSGAWRLPRWRRAEEQDADGEEPWMPDAAPVRSWLEEADALAAEGDYAGAAHHLLLRSIEDIQWRRPRLVRPALTSRDIAAAEEIPAQARTIFARIVETVERSLFGGRPVSAAEWSATRGAYADFAVRGSWRT